jgi:kynurenine formamidase
MLTAGKTQGGWFYSDAATVPLDELVAPAIVPDVSAKTDVDADYRLTVADIETWEKAHAKIAPGTIVLLRTGRSNRYPDRKRYFGNDTPGDAGKLHFPSFGLEAAKFLVEERNIAAIGVDTASIDHEPSKDFVVHQLTAAANVPAFEKSNQPRQTAERRRDRRAAHKNRQWDCRSSARYRTSPEEIGTCAIGSSPSG